MLLAVGQQTVRPGSVLAGQRECTFLVPGAVPVVDCAGGHAEHLSDLTVAESVLLEQGDCGVVCRWRPWQSSETPGHRSPTHLEESDRTSLSQDGIPVALVAKSF